MNDKRKSKGLSLKRKTKDGDLTRIGKRTKPTTEDNVKVNDFHEDSFMQEDIHDQHISLSTCSTSTAIDLERKCAKGVEDNTSSSGEYNCLKKIKECISQTRRKEYGKLGDLPPYEQSEQTEKKCDIYLLQDCREDLSLLPDISN